MHRTRAAALLFGWVALVAHAEPWAPGQLPRWATPAAPTTAEDLQARRDRLALAEALLVAGHAAQAYAAFDRMGREEHAADIELGMLRSQMQQGQYRGALAFAAHTARAHPDVAAGAALYAVLLHVGGQPAIALQTLERAEQRRPGDPALARARAVLCETATPPCAMSAADDGAVAPQERLAPYAVGVSVPEGSWVIGNALLLAGGRQAIVPARLVEGSGLTESLWLRNGLGATVRARIERRDPGTGLALLTLETALPDPATVLATSDAYPGRPAFAYGYLEGPASDGAWPRTGLGLLGRRLPGGEQLLDLAVPGGLPGAPLVDPSGRVVGLGLGVERGGRARMVGVSALRALADSASAAEPDGAAPTNRAPDELYERALASVLQVVVPRH